MYKSAVKSFFTWYIGFILRKDFSRFSFNKISFEEQRSILLLANHFSWWDGFMIFWINRLHFQKEFHVMVTEENYKKVWFLKYLGAFPVGRQPKKMIESLEHAGHLLDDPRNLVLIFPQGKLHSNHVKEIAFEKGLINLINSSNKRFQYVFSASFVDYFETRKPAAVCYLQSWEGAEFASLQLIKSAYNKHYEHSRQEQCRTIM